MTSIAGSDPETINTGTISSRYNAIVENKSLVLGGRHRIVYDMKRDMFVHFQSLNIISWLRRLWRWDEVLKTHPNGIRFSVFDADGDLLATNEYFRYISGRIV